MRTLPAANLYALLVLFFSACGGSQPAPGAPVSSEASGGPSRSPDEPPARASAPSAPVARDPKIVALATPALACKFEDDAFDDECPALKAWSENEDLFSEGKGNDTIFSMYADADLKVRLLAERKGLDSVAAYFQDKDRAAKLFALAKGETNGTVAHAFGGYVAKVDAAKMGLESELRALAKHPARPLREALAFYLISTYQTPVALEVEQMLIDDPDRSVSERAISALSTGGITPGVEPVCKMLSKQLARADELAGAALWAGSSSKCAGMKEQVAAELAKRVADPAKVTNAVGVKYALAAGGICSREGSADVKKKAFEIGKKLTTAAVPDVNTRRAALDVLVSCDPAAAEKLLGTLSTDKEKTVAAAAQKKLDELKKKK